MLPNGLPKVLFHGSKLLGLSVLRVACADERAPFGPAVYLTDNINVAQAYTGREGRVYAVEMPGERDGIVDMGLAWEVASPRLFQLMLNTFGADDLPGYGRSTRVVLDRLLEENGGRWSRQGRRAALLSAGIWMLRGELEAHEMSGFMDRGTQYACLHDVVL